MYMDLVRKPLGIKLWRMTQIETFTNSHSIGTHKTCTSPAENALFSLITRDRESVSHSVQTELQAVFDWFRFSACMGVGMNVYRCFGGM